MNAAHDSLLGLAHVCGDQITLYNEMLDEFFVQGRDTRGRRTVVKGVGAL